jgi:hypothetical protein
MIPGAQAVADAYAFVARRYGVTAKPDLAAIEAAVTEATSLAVRADDEPAALFFALARRPRALPGLWTAVVGVLVLNHARSLDLAFAGDARDLLPLFVPVARGVMSFPEVSAWFETRLAPP